MDNSVRIEKKDLTANVLFSGVGFQERGFDNSGLYNLKVLNTSEINKEAILSYAAIHCNLTPELIETYEDYPSLDEMVKELEDKNIGYQPPTDEEPEGIYYNWAKYKKNRPQFIKKYWLAVHLSNNLGDISRIKRLPYADLWTVSFPCQSISVAGKMKGFSPDSGTRSSLLWENIRLLKDSFDRGESPKYIMFENVKNLVSKTFIKDFEILLDILNDLGFNSYWDVLNAATCGIPQNRERVFVISIRKDIDNGLFTFPIPFDNGIRLKDVLQKEVDEKYYLNSKRSEDLINKLIIDGKIGGETEGNF